MKAIAAVTAAAAVLGSAPTPAQIARAVAGAERSPALWATINACARRDGTGEVGIRGQMPALGFPAQLEMTLTISYYAATAKRFRAVPRATKRIELGTVTSGTVQDGAAFRFKPPVRLEGAIRFTWLRAGRVLGVATRATTGGHRGVDEGTPPGFSAAECTLRR